MVDSRTGPIAIRAQLSRRKKAAFVCGTAFLSLALCLLLTEGVLRVCGVKPWRNRSDPVRQTIHQPDPELGWTNREARFEIPSFTKGEPDILVTNWSDGRRATAESEAPAGRPVVVAVGCSYTQGWAISDWETYPWRLQQRFPSVEVRNYGTAGFGSYQSLLTLERAFRSGLRPRLVLYGFIPDHENRNVAPDYWLKFLSQYANRGHVDVPYCTVGADDNLVRHGPERYLVLPLRESLATAAFSADMLMKLKTRSRLAQKRRVTQLLIQEMHQICRRHEAKFRVVMLPGTTEIRADYAAFCKSQEIELVDCDLALTPEYRVRGDGHPNGEMNKKWADAIASAANALLQPVDTDLIGN